MGLCDDCCLGPKKKEGCKSLHEERQELSSAGHSFRETLDKMAEHTKSCPANCPWRYENLVENLGNGVSNEDLDRVVAVNAA